MLDETQRATKRGRERHYAVAPDAIRELVEPWVRKYEKYRAASLDRLRAAAEAAEGPPDPTTRKGSG